MARDDDRHLRRVLRLRDGDPVVLADGTGTAWPARLTAEGAEIVGPFVATELAAPRLRVFQAVPKGGKLDDVVRVLTELGVDRVTPVLSARAVARPATAERARSVARAAAEQARRSNLPTIDEPMTVADCTREPLVGVVAQPGGRALADAAAELDRTVDEVAIAVGPEGGWTDDEVGAWASAGLVPVTLGSSILRTEHAAAALVAVVSYVLGRMS